MPDQNILGVLATSVQTATTVTQLAIFQSLNQPLPANYVLVVGYGTATTQGMTVASSVTAGANAIPISSTVAASNFAVGSLLGVAGGGENVVVTSIPASTASTATVTAATVTSMPSLSVTSSTVGASTVNAFTVLLAGEDLTNNVMKVEQRFSYTNINTATTTVVKSSAGFLHAITFNKPVASEVWTLYDSTTSSGTKIGTITLPAALLQEGPYTGVYDVSFLTGLTITSSTVSDGTVSWR